MSNTDPTKNRAASWTQVFAKGKRFLPRKRHPPWYEYSQHVLNTTMHKQTQIT
jgi:preprotein translocase subunit Sss1